MELQKFFEPGKLPKIVVLGDLMLDRYIFGSVSRISPEAPVPVLKHGSCKEVIGGSGNVAANIVAMGATVSLISLTGDDQNRDVVLNLCHEFDVQTANLVKSTTRQTTIKTRYLSGNQQILRLDDEDASIMTEAEHSAVIHNLSEALENADCLVLSDYDKGMFKGDIAPQAIKLATAMNIPVIVDPKGHDYKKYHGATLITPNLKELQEAVSRTVYTDKEVVEACRELIAKFDLDFLCATRSENGMSIVSESEEKHIPTYAKEVFDVSGAGDTVVATLSVGLARGLERDSSAYIANVAAGLAVSKQGTARISKQEIQTELEQRKVLSIADRTILTWDEVKTLSAGWRKEGHIVGMTNGCFDILHVGHVTSLNKARQQCDKLILALNSDASVSRLKGDSRPINGAEDRAGTLAGLSAVDAIVVFDEDTPLNLIKHLLPDRLFKGADYAVEDVVGGKEVIENGGEVVLIEFVEGRSTTKTIEKMTNSGS